MSAYVHPHELLVVASCGTKKLVEKEIPLVSEFSKEINIQVKLL